ncbi:ATP-binding protein [Saccharopolyspora cebuensis]|uniref:ATP-binding protein n=1 Tax=Saccharopolyspora cebuensis TaxID=418759 RepID=A0ABV4CTB8_9PSEU
MVRGGGDRSLQEIVRRRQGGDFVGRERHCADFRANLARPPQDPKRAFVLALHGQAGVGKTFLLRRWRQIAVDSGTLVAELDGSEPNLVSALSTIAVQFAGQGGRTPAFAQRLAEYEQRQDEVLADPEAPQAAREFLVASAVRMGLSAVRAAAPGAALLVDAVEPEQVRGWLERSRAFFAAKFRDHADVRLLMSPVDELTPHLVADLRRLAQHRDLVLLFDDFERTAPLVEPWLLRLLRGHHGELPSEVVFGIAGQHPLDVNRWGEYASIAVQWRVDRFSPEEARALLRRKGVDDPAFAAGVLEVSGGLPLLVAAMADSGPATAEELQDPTGTAVERFLKWESERGRDDALVAALPRVVDEDVLAALVGSQRVPELFPWLRDRPFVRQDRGRLHYSEVVRATMVRHERGRSPSRFVRCHRALAGHYGHRLAALGLAGELVWEDPEARGLLVEETYHRLCADPRGELPTALARCVEIAERVPRELAAWARAFAEAGRDAGAPRLAERAEDLRARDPARLREHLGTAASGSRAVAVPSVSSSVGDVIVGGGPVPRPDRGAEPDEVAAPDRYLVEADEELWLGESAPRVLGE